MRIISKSMAKDYHGRWSSALEARRLRAIEEPQYGNLIQDGVQRQGPNEIAFFGKFVLCSNNEHFPIVIDREEVRYWVRKDDEDNRSFAYRCMMKAHKMLKPAQCKRKTYRL